MFVKLVELDGDLQEVEVKTVWLEVDHQVKQCFYELIVEEHYGVGVVFSLIFRSLFHSVLLEWDFC
jgi:hypothetical protein